MRNSYEILEKVPDSETENRYDTNDSSQKSVVFLSGLFAGGWVWDLSVPQLKTIDRYVMKDPFCNLGGSLQEISDKIIADLKKIKGKVSLVSNSLGGLSSLYIANLIPDKIEKLILSGAAGFQKVNLDLKINRRQPKRMRESLLDFIFFDPKKADEKNIERVASYFQENLKNIIHLTREGNSISAELLLENITCPIYGIWGDNDNVTPLNPILPILNRHHISTQVIKDCGHSPMIEKPDEFSRLLNQYLMKDETSEFLKN